MPVSGFRALLLPVQIRERGGLELDVPGERLVGRAHEGVVDIVAVAVQVAEPDRMALALLRAIDLVGGEAIVLEAGDSSGIFLIVHVVAGRFLI